MLVEVVEASRGTFRPTIATMGTVEPSREIQLGPRVSGEVVELAEGFTPGGLVAKGEVLLKLDPSDYEAALEQERAQLRQAESDLSLEMGRQNVARRDYELLEEELAGESRDLVLREPQLEAARAQVESALAAVRQAELNLERTTLRAPFDAQTLTREVNVGSQVSPGDLLGRLVGRETYWVATAVPLSHLRWIGFGEDGEEAAVARIRNRAAWPEGVHREGRVYKLVGTLESSTRMARVLVSVPDPLGDRSVGSERPPLMIGAFVQVLIEGREIADVVRVNRDYVRQRDTIWVMEDKKLRIRDLDIVFEDEQWAYVSKGLEDGDRVVATNLSTPTDGADLRLEGENDEGADAYSETGDE